MIANKDLMNINRYLLETTSIRPYNNVKIIGSYLHQEFFHDIDIVTDTESIFSTLLYAPKELKVHPVLLTKDIFSHIEDYNTFYNFNMSCDLIGNVKYGDGFTDSKELVFNPKSLIVFNNYNIISKQIKKYEERGYNINDENAKRIRAYFLYIEKRRTAARFRSMQFNKAQ